MRIQHATDRDCTVNYTRRPPVVATQKIQTTKTSAAKAAGDNLEYIGGTSSASIKLTSPSDQADNDNASENI